MNIFIINKYTRIYCNIIERAKSRKPLPRNKTELHHILPKALYPSCANLTKHKWNGVYLTFKEHFVCHLLLIKMLEGENKSKMSFALHRMKMSNIGTNRITSPYMYELFRQRVCFGHSTKTKNTMSINRSGDRNSFYGKRHTNESRGRMGKSRYGSDNPNFGRTVSDENKDKIRRANTGRKANRVCCVICQKDLPVNIFAAFHGDKCTSPNPI